MSGPFASNDVLFAQAHLRLVGSGAKEPKSHWIFQADHSWVGARDFKFKSRKTSWATVWMDPSSKKRYYHSVVGKLTLTAAQVRAG